MVTVEGTAAVDTVEAMLLESFSLQVHALVRGNLPDGCTSLGEVRVTRDGNTFNVTLPITRPQDAMCTQALVPYEVFIPLEVRGLPAGTYTVNVKGS